MSDLYDSFRRAVDCPEDRIDLDRATLEICRSEYPHVNVEGYLSRLDELGQVTQARVGESRSPYRIIAAINTVLFKELGYRGNRADYYDPKNSFLTDVIERRAGIPISLSVLYMEVARRVGLALQGVGFPGHFLIKYQRGDGEILIDAFDRGEILTREDLDRLLKQLYGGKLSFQASFLATAGKREILKRMLNNLKMIYLQRNEALKALSIVEHLIILDPISAADLRDRGLLYIQLECYAQGLEDLENYLNRAPEAEDAAMIRARVATIKQHSIRLH